MTSSVSLLTNYSDCSVFYLPHGSFKLFNTDNELISSNNASLYKPALYITNCSGDYGDVYDYYMDYLKDLNGSGQTLITNEAVDSYRISMILILFAYSAIVVSSWMLLLVLFLSSHKKPNSIKLANLLFSISVSIILDQTTKLLEADTKLDTQDIDHFEKKILNGLRYLILLLICQFVTWIAWLEIMIYIMPVNLQKKVTKIGLLMILINILLVGLNSFYQRDQSINETSNVPIEILTTISQVSIQVSFFVLFIMYTVKKHKMAYNRQTMPLATITILFMLTPFTFYLIMKYAETLRTWSGLFYSFGQIMSCALIWEWIFDIEMISKQVELKGIVGREIDQSFNNGNNFIMSKRKRFKLKNLKKKHNDKSQIGDEEEGYELNNISIYSSINGGDEDDGYDYDYDYESSISRSSGLSDISNYNENEPLNDNNNSNNNNNNDNNIHTGIESANEGSSSQHQVTPEEQSDLQLPPDFEPHPNFDIGDYWLDEKNHLRRSD